MYASRGAPASPDGSLRLERGRSRARSALVFALMAAALLGIAFASVNSGSVHVSWADIVQIVSGRSTDVDASNIVWKIRLPRIVMAVVLGGALGIAGFLLQTFFENPIAGPFVLGISQGAKTAVAFALIFCIGTYGKVSSWTLILAAFVGALVVTGFILLVARRVESMAVLLLAGIMIGYICSAVTEFTITFASDADIANLHGWSQGSFGSADWGNVQVACVVTAVACVCALMLSKPIGAYLLGEAYARSAGVNVRRFRVALIVLSSVLSATVTAFVGPVSFVGIAVPYLMKNALGTARPIVVMPATFLGGAVFCLACDLIARTAFAPLELNISTVTAFFGAPVVIYMMVSRRRGAVRGRG